MTTLGLMGLASRRLAAARNQAAQRLGALRNAVQVIKQAEQQAEHQIRLDLSLVKKVNVADSQVQKTDYVRLLKICEKAAAARDQIVNAARQSSKHEREQQS